MKLVNIKVKDSDEWFNLYVSEDNLESNIKKELEFYSKVRNININDLIVQK